MDKKEFDTNIEQINKFADKLRVTGDRSDLALACILKNLLVAVKVPNNEELLMSLVEATIFVSESMVAGAEEISG
jgi:hypothetical protein